MPIFYFHVRDETDRPDPTGTELFDWEQARVEALALAGQTLKDAALRRSPGPDWRITVTDERGLTLFIMDFAMAESAGVASCGPLRR